MLNDWTVKFLSPSRVDTFIQFLTGYEYNFGDNYKEFTNEAFIDKLLKLEPQSNFRKANAGTACHSLIERAKFMTLDGCYLVDNWLIEVPEHDIELSYPDCREQWLRLKIEGIEILGKVDGVNLTSIHDLKFTSKVDFEKYINSYQWKMYLLGSGLDKMVYDIFEVKVHDTLNQVEIKDYHKLELYRYSAMEQEVINVLHEYVDLLYALEPAIIARVSEYNGMIDATIAQLNASGLVTAESEINAFVAVLEKKKIVVKGLTDSNIF